jgi:hypothetical protein
MEELKNQTLDSHMHQPFFKLMPNTTHRKFQNQDSLLKLKHLPQMVKQVKMAKTLLLMPKNLKNLWTREPILQTLDSHMHQPFSKQVIIPKKFQNLDLLQLQLNLKQMAKQVQMAKKPSLMPKILKNSWTEELTKQTPDCHTHPPSE